MPPAYTSPASPPLTPPSDKTETGTRIHTTTTTTAPSPSSRPSINTSTDAAEASPFPPDDDRPNLSDATIELVALVRRREERATNAQLYAPNDVVITISPDQLDAAWTRLEQRYPSVWAFLETEERWSYDPLTLRLVLHAMPTRYHEHLIDAIVVGIRQRAIEAFASAPAALDLWGQIHNARSAAVEIPAPTTAPQEDAKDGRKHGQMVPDDSWVLDTSGTPSCVLEVGWTQRRAKLLKKCTRWILETRGEVRTVLAVQSDHDPDYRATEPPRTTVYLYRYNLQDGTYYADREFGPADPTNAKAGVFPLRLELADFVPYAKTLKDVTIQHTCDEAPPIDLPADFFLNAIARAFASHRIRSKSPTPLPDEMATAKPGKRPLEEEEEEDTAESSSASASFGSDHSSYKPPRAQASSSSRATGTAAGSSGAAGSGGISTRLTSRKKAKINAT